MYFRNAKVLVVAVYCVYFFSVFPTLLLLNAKTAFIYKNISISSSIIIYALHYILCLVVHHNIHGYIKYEISPIALKFKENLIQNSVCMNVFWSHYTRNIYRYMEYYLEVKHSVLGCKNTCSNIFLSFLYDDRYTHIFLKYSNSKRKFIACFFYEENYFSFSSNCFTDEK